MKADRESLAEHITRALPSDGRIEPQPGIAFSRVSIPRQPVHGVLEPSFCVIAQGSKDILLNTEHFRYDPAHYLISTIGVPAIGEVIEASRSRPYLSFQLFLDPALVTSVMMDSAAVASRTGSVKAVDVSPLDANLLDATLRLVKLTDKPTEYRVLAPLVIREIIFRLLNGAQAARMHHLAKLGGRAHRMFRAVAKLREHFDQPLRIERLAKELGMSPSGFHAHFKTVTAMSPLQFQKQLRFQEARRLMLSENLDAAQAGYRVGYDDPSHFSREYKGHFGEPPARDVKRLRELANSH